MTQDNKELLLRYICAMLSYGLMCQVDVGAAGFDDGKLEEIDIPNERVRFADDGYWDADIDDVKPYLRPLTSMTTEEEYEFHQIMKRNSDKSLSLMDYNDHLQQLSFFIIVGVEIVDWLNKHHFDYYGLIEKGLALEAPKGMYK